MKYRIYLKAFSKKIMNDSLQILFAKLGTLKNVKYYSIALPTRIKKFCVLRSPHINKDSREQFEIRILKRFVDITCEHPAELFSIFENFSLPAGIACFFGIIEK